MSSRLKGEIPPCRLACGAAYTGLASQALRWCGPRRSPMGPNETRAI